MTTKSKKDALASAVGRTGKTLVERPERASLAENRDKLFEKFYANLRLLVATETISMVELSRHLGLKSGARISDLCYGKGTPSTEEVMILAHHFNCSMDALLNQTATISFQ
jgi:hypothetical protein